jgi:hypothetical protein
MSIEIPSAVSQKAMQYLLDDQVVSSLGNSVPALIEAVNFSANLKDAQTGKCILTNSHNAYLHKGLETLQSPDDLIGLTSDDLLEIGCFIPLGVMKSTALKIHVNNEHRARIEATNRLDHEVKMLKRKVMGSCTTILDTGFIYSNTVVKWPILSSDQRKVVAILTCYYDRTPSLSLPDLFQLHLAHYSSQFAIKVLLHYLKIADYFKAPPTAREMEVLLLMRGNSRRKYIAKQLNISRNTAASHIQHIKELKLIKPDIDEVTFQLRRVPAGLSTG